MSKRKKEIIIIVFILLISLVLVIIPFFTQNKKIETKGNTTTTSSYIKIKIVGEINYFIDGEIVNFMVKEYPKGISFGEAQKSFMNFYTKYSYTDYDLKYRFYEDSEIIIYSNCKTIEEIDSNVGKIDINKASFDELVKLYGIGEKRAKTIINYRNNKLFTSFTELKSILGVSDGFIEQLKTEAFL